MAVSISHDSLSELVRQYGPVLDGVDETLYNTILIANIESYLSFLGVKSVIVEEDYIDTHILDDYCGHYGRCFADYKRKCVRLHFFDKDFDIDKFNRLLISRPGKDEISATVGNYRGCIVLRNIPGSVFGKICLAVPEVESQYAKVIGKLYETHLCGLTFTLYSVAFQEQDHAISACATVALWMGFNAFPGIQPREVLSPYRIFEIVRKQHADGNLSHIVGKGLNVAQISSVIKERSLEPLVIRPETFGYAKAVAKAYLEMDIPIILGVDLIKMVDEPSDDYFLGKHAVTVIGFQGNEQLLPFKENTKSLLHTAENNEVNLYLESSAMKCLIVHDDQIGPYSKMLFTSEYGLSMKTKWTDYNDGGAVDAKIDVMTIMNFRKVRIRFSSILEITKELNNLICNSYRREGFFISWDIHLTNVWSLKEKVRLKRNIGNKDKVSVLTATLPRYIWVVGIMGRYKDDYSDKTFEIQTHYFDATDIETSGFYLFSLNYTPIGLTTKIAMEEIDLTKTKLCRSNMQLRKTFIDADASNPIGFLSNLVR